MPRASSAPAVTTKELDTRDQVIGQAHERAMSSTGPASDSLEEHVVESANPRLDRKWADDLAFAEGKIEIMVHDTNNKMDEPIPDIYCNGIPQRFIRGQTQVVKRKFVAILARAKVTSYTQRKQQDSQGIESYVNQAHIALKYPFSLVNQTAEDAAWLKAMLEEAT